MTFNRPEQLLWPFLLVYSGAVFRSSFSTLAFLALHIVIYSCLTYS